MVSMVKSTRYWQQPAILFLAKRIALSLGLYHDTFFAYPQIYIKNTLLNNIRALRNSMFAPFGTTESQAKAMANAQNQPVYITYRKADEKGYGEDNKINKNENNVELDEGGYASKVIAIWLYGPTVLTPELPIPSMS